MRSSIVAACCFVIAVAGCSRVDPRLAEVKDPKFESVVVRDQQDKYWAIPTVGIERVDGAKLMIRAQTVMVRGEGEGSEEELDQNIPSSLMNLARRSNVGGFGMTETSMKAETWSMTGKIEVTAEPREIVVAKVLLLE
jgi:hypothetical protein